MKCVYSYFFMRIYLLMKTMTSRTADDAALMLLLITVFFYTIPFFTFLLKTLSPKMSLGVFVIVGLCYGFILYKINKWYFIERQELVLILDRYKNKHEDELARILIDVLVAFIVIGSLPASFLLLRIIL